MKTRNSTKCIDLRPLSESYSAESIVIGAKQSSSRLETLSTEYLVTTIIDEDFTCLVSKVKEHVETVKNKEICKEILKAIYFPIAYSSETFFSLLSAIKLNSNFVFITESSINLVILPGYTLVKLPTCSTSKGVGILPISTCTVNSRGLKWELTDFKVSLEAVLVSTSNEFVSDEVTFIFDEGSFILSFEHSLFYKKC